MAKEFLVKGGQCMCKFGSSPGIVTILDNSYFRMNGDKLAATTLSLQNTFEPPGFGTCRVNPLSPKPCVPAVTLWNNPLTEIRTSAGGNPLTEESKGTCGSGGPDCITVIQTGQIPVPGISDFEEASSEHQDDLDPVGAPAGLTEDQIELNADAGAETIQEDEGNQPEIVSISWEDSIRGVVNNVSFYNKIDLNVELANYADGELLEIEICPDQFNPRDEKYIYKETLEVKDNSVSIKSFPITMHWPIVATVRDDERGKELKSSVLTIWESDGCGFQYIKHYPNDPEQPSEHIVEVDVHVIISSDPRDNYNYKDRENIERLEKYLDEGFNGTRRRRNQYTDEEGRTIKFIFNMHEYGISKGYGDRMEFLRAYNQQIRDFIDKGKRSGKYGCRYNPAVLAARILDSVGMEGGKGGTYGGGLICLPGGTRATSNESLDKSIIHEMVHAFYSYNNGLSMGNDARKHNDRSLGGTGALSYGGNSQLGVNQTNVNKIIETLPYAEDVNAQ